MAAVAAVAVVPGGVNCVSSSDHCCTSTMLSASDVSCPISKSWSKESGVGLGTERVDGPGCRMAEAACRVEVVLGERKGNQGTLSWLVMTLIFRI